MTMRRDNALIARMSFQGRDRQGVVWRISSAGAPSGLPFTIAPRMVELPAQHLRDPACGGPLGLRSDRIADILSTKK